MTRTARAVRVLVILTIALSSSIVWAASAKKTHGSRPPKQAVAPGKLADSFESFCGTWMQKLRVREADNLAHIDWQTGPDTVSGTYVGYSQDYTCTLTSGAQPVGKIMYREMRYEKRGANLAEAKDSAPQTVEIVETSELFSYIGGKWAY